MRDRPTGWAEFQQSVVTDVVDQWRKILEAFLGVVGKVVTVCFLLR